MADSTLNAGRLVGTVPAALPLTLLEAVRSHDRPEEVLEDENLTASLPRRFGLTDVVDTQIRQFEAAQRAGRNVRLDDVANLMRLVLRRPDAAAIMRDTGRRFAEWDFDRRNGLLRALTPKLPQRLAHVAAARAIRRTLKLLNAGAAIEVTRQPFHVRVHGCTFARIDAEGGACALLTGLLQEHIRRYLHTDAPVVHGVCAAKGAAADCEWSMWLTPPAADPSAP
jgi:hypothetical protein